MVNITHTTQITLIQSTTYVRIISEEAGADGQEYLPAELAANSSLSNTPDLHFLKTPEAEAREKKWDDERLREWEEEVNGAEKWEGRSQR